MTVQQATGARRIVGSAVACVLLVSTQAFAQGATPLYKQAGAPVAERVRDLLGRMTLEEKVAQLQSNSTLPLFPGLPVGPKPAFGIVKNGQIDETVARRALGDGLGVFCNVSLSPLPVAQGVALQNAVQDWVLKNTRLGIPVIFQAEGLHGAVVSGATSYPQAVALGSTWDPALIRRMFTEVARELRASGMSMTLAPVFDLSRDPRFGRVEEMYSEDPYLVGEMGTAAVEGLQGQGPGFDQEHVIATAKHFVHGQPEGGQNAGPNDVSERTMRSVFFPPFEKAVKVAHIGAVMPSYNENDGGVPSSVNRWLLTEVLRREWGFTGVTDSDWFAVPQLHSSHHVATDDADAGVQAFNAGLDMESPNPDAFAGLADAVRSGKVRQADVDAAVVRVLTLKVRAGLFEHPFTDPALTKAVVGAPTEAPLARKVADEAIVLLKNENRLLPLDPARITSLAVIGPNANKGRLGGYSGTPPYVVTVLQGLKARLGPRVHVAYAEGVRISEPDNDPATNKLAPYVAPSAAADEAGIAAAVQAAQAAQVVVLVLGDNETVTREATGTSLGDTDNLDLPGRQQELVDAVMKLGKPTVAVLLNGRARSIVKLSQSAGAILEGWYLGQEAGNAVADVMFGDVNPSGRLPVTVPRSAGQLPVFYYHSPLARLGYIGEINTPLYPFGYGLSYTRFTYAKPTLDRASIGLNGTARASVAVTNAGMRSGDEVVQMYVHHTISSVVQPVMRLQGFQRVHLEPGQTRTVSFDVGPEQLAIWNRDMKRVVEPGAVDVMIGPNAADTTPVQLQVTP